MVPPGPPGRVGRRVPAAQPRPWRSPRPPAISPGTTGCGTSPGYELGDCGGGGQRAGRACGFVAGRPASRPAVPGLVSGGCRGAAVRVTTRPRIGARGGARAPLSQARRGDIGDTPPRASAWTPAAREGRASRRRSRARAARATPAPSRRRGRLVSGVASSPGSPRLRRRLVSGVAARRPAVLRSHPRPGTARAAHHPGDSPRGPLPAPVAGPCSRTTRRVAGTLSRVMRGEPVAIRSLPGDSRRTGRARAVRRSPG
jgi:hypothetical protein